MSNRLWFHVLLFSAALLGAPPPLAWGADPAAELNDHARWINRMAQGREGEQRVVEHLSRELNVPTATLRAQREQSKLGWGELSIAYRLSQKTGVPVSQLISEHKSGKGWGVIAKAHNVNLGGVVGEAKESARALEAKAQKGKKGDEGDKAGPPDVERGRGAGGPPDLGGGPGTGRGGGRGR